jgi:hypothetical protein
MNNEIQNAAAHINAQAIRQSLPHRAVPERNGQQQRSTPNQQQQRSIPPTTGQSKPKQTRGFATETNEKTRDAVPAPPGQCFICKGAHHLTDCEVFLGCANRVELLILFKLCIYCGRHKYSAQNKCKKQKFLKCDKCDGSHITLLHPNYKDIKKGSANTAVTLDDNETEEESTETTAATTADEVINNTADWPQAGLIEVDRDAHLESAPENEDVDIAIDNLHLSTVIFPTAVANIRDSTGLGVPLRCMLDECSSRTYVREDVVQKLGLKKHGCHVKVKGINGISGNVKHFVFLTLLINDPEIRSIRTPALVVPSVTGPLPDTDLDVDLRKIKHKLADPTFGKRSRVHVLIGAEVHNILMLANVGSEKLDNLILAQQQIILESTISAYVESLQLVIRSMKQQHEEITEQKYFNGLYDYYMRNRESFPDAVLPQMDDPEEILHINEINTKVSPNSMVQINFNIPLVKSTKYQRIKIISVPDDNNDTITLDGHLTQDLLIDSSQSFVVERPDWTYLGHRIYNVKATKTLTVCQQQIIRVQSPDNCTHHANWKIEPDTILLGEASSDQFMVFSNQSWTVLCDDHPTRLNCSAAIVNASHCAIYNGDKVETPVHPRPHTFTPGATAHNQAIEIPDIKIARIQPNPAILLMKRQLAAEIEMMDDDTKWTWKSPFAGIMFGVTVILLFIIATGALSRHRHQQRHITPKDRRINWAAKWIKTTDDTPPIFITNSE